MLVRSTRSEHGLLLTLERAAPHAVPIVAEEVRGPPIAVEEPVRHLEHAEQQHALRSCPGLVPAPGRAPDEVARLALAFPANEAAFQHIGLLTDLQATTQRGRLPKEVDLPLARCRSLGQHVR